MAFVNLADGNVPLHYMEKKSVIDCFSTLSFEVYIKENYIYTILS